ncbi:MAG: DUF4145 domain-containing protein [Betaproteobacteria bacterium]|nr:MAG: DUF4145 domain-containing protein [Betaproteobacteria bacterium]
MLAHEQIGSGRDEDYRWNEHHYFARCAGCDSFTYAIESWSEDDWNPHTGEMDSTWKTYPRGATERQPMTDVDELPAKVQLIYSEVIGAMNAQLPVLAGIGLRAVIEAVCREQKISGGNLQALIDGLATTGVLSKAQADILHGHRFLGNVAAHEVTSAPPRELVAALDIAENVLRTIYVLPKLSKQVKTGRKP